jgi:hypothetical protein
MKEDESDSGSGEVSGNAIGISGNIKSEDVTKDKFHEISQMEEFSSIYQKLGSLCTEIEHQILDLDLNHLDTARHAIQWMKNESLKDLNPEVDYLTRLYRYYNGEIQQKLHKHSASLASSVSQKDMIHLVDYVVPRFVYDGTADQIVGYEALNSNVFWIRLVTSIFALISFIVMSCVPMISHKRVSPHMLFYVSHSPPRSPSPPSRMTALSKTKRSSKLGRSISSPTNTSSDWGWSHSSTPSSLPSSTSSQSMRTPENTSQVALLFLCLKPSLLCQA